MEDKGNILMNRYEVGRLLGQGTFAKVFYARSVITGQSVAIKIIDKEKVMKIGLVQQIKREIMVMRLVRHPNVVTLYEVMASKTKIYFVMEYAKGGELFDKVAKGRLSEDVARKYFHQLINAVDYCHSRGVFHRDLKPENLLLDENDNLKVSDFGLSALVETTRQDGLLHTTCGTPAYVAPEVIHRKGYDGVKADIWSCGVILYVLLAGFLPFHDSNLMQLYRKISRADFKFPSWFPSDVRRLLVKMLDPSPVTRIPIHFIRGSSWFRKGPRVKQIKEGEDVVPESSEIRQASELPFLNAFDIISYTSGIDLSGLFEENGLRREVRFTSKKSAATIFSKIEEIAKRLKLKIKKQDKGLVKLEGSHEGRKGIISINAEVFEVTPSFHLVELVKSSGDTIEYRKILKEDIRPALQDIVWVWQND